MILFRRVLLVVVLAVSCSRIIAQDEEDTGGSTTTTASEVGESTPTTTTSVSDKTSPSSPSCNENDWGSFYDPNNIFCGKYDCYKILCFDYETWVSSDPPTLKAITKSYRNLSRKWHPDKNKAKGAREKFVAIAKAYEILTNREKRAEYDHFRDRPDEYYKKYGSSVLWAYAPQTDATLIIIIFLLAGNVFTYYAQYSRWQKIAKHLIRAATEDWSPRQGGSKESSDIREQALVILADKKKKKEEENDEGGVETSTTNNNGTGTHSGSGINNGEKKKKSPKLTPSEKKEKEWDELRPICTELVNKIDDFGAGFRKPTLHDLLIVRMVKWPYFMTKSILWWSKYAVRRLKKLDLNNEEREVLTKNAVGEIAWVTITDEERSKLLTLELWKSIDALVEWKEEQQMKNLGISASKRKLHKKIKQRGKGNDDEDHID